MVNLHTWRAAFAHGVMKRYGVERVPPRTVEKPTGLATINAESGLVSDWTLAGEVVGRKIEVGNRATFWLEPGLAIEAELALAHEREEDERVAQRVVGEVAAMIEAQDRHNAERRGITPEAYKRERLARDHRQAMKSGVNSRGMK